MQAAAPREVGLYVAGLPRTGTASFALAMYELGRKPCHGPDHIGFADEIAAYFDGNLSGSEMLKAFGREGFDVVGLDVAGATFYKAAAAQPGLKVVLTVRDSPEQWASSFLPTIGMHPDALSSLPWSLVGAVGKLAPLVRSLYGLYPREQAAPGNPLDPAVLQAAYKRHNAAVRAAVPADRLLEFNVKEGWEPLCRFLELAKCPTTPFPRANDKLSAVRQTQVLVAVTWIWPLLALLPVVAVATCVSRCCRCTGGTHLKAKGA